MTVYAVRARACMETCLAVAVTVCTCVLNIQHQSQQQANGLTAAAAADQTNLLQNDVVVVCVRVCGCCVHA